MMLNVFAVKVLFIFRNFRYFASGFVLRKIYNCTNHKAGRAEAPAAEGLRAALGPHKPTILRWPVVHSEHLRLVQKFAQRAIYRKFMH